jgi:hypothetical protein
MIGVERGLVHADELGDVGLWNAVFAPQHEEHVEADHRNVVRYCTFDFKNLAASDPRAVGSAAG